MKKTVLSFLLAMIILMSAVACTPDEPAPDTTTAGITTEDPDATTTAEPEDNPADGSTTTGVTFWGWTAVKGELGSFGYRIHG